MQRELPGRLDASLLKTLVFSKERHVITFDDYVLLHSSMELQKKLNKKFKVDFDFEILRRKENEIRYIHSYHKTNLRHQLGSILKPIIYSIILKDKSLEEMVSGEVSDITKIR